MISCSSSFGSSTPATSLKVTFFCWLDVSFARLRPNDMARFPGACICRMRKKKSPTMSRIGNQLSRVTIQGVRLASSASTLIPRSSRVDTRPSISGAKVLKELPSTSVPVISLPAPVPLMRTSVTLSSSTRCMNWVNDSSFSSSEMRLETFQNRISTSEAVSQNMRFFIVELISTQRSA